MPEDIVQTVYLGCKGEREGEGEGEEHKPTYSKKGMFLVKFHTFLLQVLVSLS